MLRLLGRILLLPVMIWFAFRAVIGYAFEFRLHGYPLWPLFGTAITLAIYLKLRPLASRERPREIRSFSDIDHAFLLLILSIVSSAFLLDKRGENPFTPTYFIHLSTLTFFLLLLPFMVSCVFGRERALVTAISTLLLMFLLLDGTMRDPKPLAAAFADFHFERPLTRDETGLQPMAIIPPAAVNGDGRETWVPENGR
ncbi:MAG TPA: hypothetical protein VNQ90_03805 [Chthoniobacteraceae bacterium]|nr:hypothetical protein [Chthoniobacteraceae bacterium]